MEIKQITNITLNQCLTINEYVKKVKERTGIDSISPQTIHYHTKEGNKHDMLDWIWFCGMKLIIMNEKAEKFVPTEGKKTRFISTLSLEK